MNFVLTWPHDLLEAEGGQVMTLVNDHVSILGNTVFHFTLPGRKNWLAVLASRPEEHKKVDSRNPHSLCVNRRSGPATFDRQEDGRDLPTSVRRNLFAFGG